MNYAALLAPDMTFAAAGESSMIDSGLLENGQPIRLQVVIFKPEGAGPFPLLVVNHGSTGKGTDSKSFKQVFVDRAFAKIFVNKGYLVAFPQRRGRGKSDGLYDEGFYADRTLGYTCEPERALAGADRALVDIEAAVAALRRRQDVKDGRVLMAGVSRGGALSIAYAGMHPHGRGRDQLRRRLDHRGVWLGGKTNQQQVAGARRGISEFDAVAVRTS